MAAREPAATGPARRGAWIPRHCHRPFSRGGICIGKAVGQVRTGPGWPRQKGLKVLFPRGEPAAAPIVFPAHEHPIERCYRSSSACLASSYSAGFRQDKRGIGGSINAGARRTVGRDCRSTRGTQSVSRDRVRKTTHRRKHRPPCASLFNRRSHRGPCGGGELSSGHRGTSKNGRTQHVLGFCHSEAARLRGEPVSVCHALGRTCDPLAAARCSVLCTRPYHWSKIALILGPYVYFTAADLGRFAIKRRPSGWRSGPSGSDRQADDGGTPR